MPYIAIKAYPKDEKTKKEIVEKINQLFLETWGCPSGSYQYIHGRGGSGRLGGKGG